MRHVIAILFGAAFTMGTAAALGSLLLRRLRVSLYREEAVLFGLLGGAALTSRVRSASSRRPLAASIRRKRSSGVSVL